MLVRYMIFCLGCGMVQEAAVRTPFPWQGEAVRDVPIWFMNPRMFQAVQLLALASVIAEIWVGFSASKWVGLVTWIPFIWAATLLFPGKNPGPCFFVGVLVSGLGLLLLLIA